MNFNEDRGGKSDKRLLPPFVLCSLSILLFLSGLYLPFLGVFVALLAPAPLAVMGLRYGFRSVLIGIVFASLILYVSFGELVTISFILGTGVLGAALVLIAPKMKTAGEAMLLFVVASIAAKIMFMSAVMSVTGTNPFVPDEASLRSILGSFPTESGVISQISLLVPAFLTLAAGLDCFVNYLLVSKIELRTEGSKAKIPQLPPLQDWRFPRSLLVALLVALILPIFEVEGEVSRVIVSAELNLKIIVNVLFFIQGLSFVLWWTLQKKLSRTVRFIIIFVLLIPIFSMGLIALGIGDIWLNLRDRLEKIKGAKK